MRKFFSFGICSLLICLSFLNGFSQTDKTDDNKNKIQGNGHVITRDVPVQPFDQLEANGVFSVMLTQGDKESLKIEAEDNLQDLYEVKNDGGKLIVSMKKDSHFNSKKRMIVYITFKNLKSMDLRMVGDLNSEGNLNFGDLTLENKSVGNVELVLSAQKLEIENSSVGNLKLSGKVENAVIKSSGVGAVRAGELVVQTLDIDNTGVGSAEVNAAKEIKVKDSFLGKVRNVSNTNPKRINKVVI